MSEATSKDFRNRMNHESDADFIARQRLQNKLNCIKHKIVVMSGKGGVGKSTVAVNLATALLQAGNKVGLLDVDVHGPSIPTMLGLENATLSGTQEELLPVDLDGLKIMSVGFLLSSPDQAVIWRGPMKISVIRQFLENVDWGELDYLIIDCPPGTGDEPLSVCQLIGHLDGAVVVTTPQRVATVDVRKSISFCRQISLKVLGIIENMSGFVCPKCGEITEILPSGGGGKMAEEMGVPFLGAIPLDPQVAQAGDSGQAFLRHYTASPTAAIMQKLIKPILNL